MSWPTVELGDCCEIVSGATPKTGVDEFWDGDVRWVTPKDLSDLNGAYIAETPRKITDEGLRSCAATVLPSGSVLLSSRAPIGYVAINTQPMATNQGFKSLVPDVERISAEYLAWWLKANRSYLEGLGNGATFKEVSKATVSRVEIPLPPLEEQRRISEVLDGVDALRAKRREAIALLDSLAQSIYLDMFGDQQWDVRELGTVADISSGITKGRKAVAPTRPVPYLAVANVQLMHLNLADVKRIDATEAEIERYRLMRDDLLLTEGGDPDKLGRGTLWHDEIVGCIHQNHIFRVRISEPSIVAPVFLNWFVASDQGRKYFLRSAKQTTGIASINATQLREFPLATPPLSLQQSFAERVEAIEAEKAKHRAHLAKLDELFNSVQSRAFAGTLFG